MGWKTKCFITSDCRCKTDEHLKRFIKDPNNGVCKNEIEGLRQTVENKSAVKLFSDDWNAENVDDAAIRFLLLVRNEFGN